MCHVPHPPTPSPALLRAPTQLEVWKQSGVGAGAHTCTGAAHVETNDGLATKVRVGSQTVPDDATCPQEAKGTG